MCILIGTVSQLSDMWSKGLLFTFMYIHLCIYSVPVYVFPLHCYTVVRLKFIVIINDQHMIFLLLVWIYAG